MTRGPGSEQPELRKAAPERMAAAVLPVSAAAWGLAWAAHETGFVPPHDVFWGAAVTTAVSWGAAARYKDDVPPSLPWWAGIGGGLLAAADELGPLAWWPAPLLTAAWIVYAVAAARFARRHDAVVSAREWREAKGDWLERRHRWGLGGSHLLDFQQTRLGELYTVDVRGTGKRRSQLLASSAVAEHIAQEEGLDENRVRLLRHGPAGRIRVSVRRRDPWAEPVLHPLACDGHEITLPERRSILDLALVGQDPETGEPLAVPLCDENGAKRVSATANSGGGKGVLEDDLFEHVTACEDALAVHLNLSVKGGEDAGVWGPACWLTAYGPGQKQRAARILEVLAALIEWRTQNFRRGRYRPSPEHPAVVIFHDESDSEMAAVGQLLNVMATKGRSHGVAYVHFGQRNTREYVNPKARSQDNVRCTGLVQNSNEARHAGSGAGPDMSTYGEGRPGVWKVELLGARMSLGRTWVFHRTEAGHVEACERIAAGRADYQPEITGACREHLGSPLEALLATDVYARWAHERDGAEPPDGEPAGDGPGPAAAPADAPADPGGPAVSAAPGGARTALAGKDPLEEWLSMDATDHPDTDARAARVREKLAGARQALEEAAALPRPVPGLSPEQRAARAAERWRQVGEAARIPDGALPRLLEMLGGEGTTISRVAAEFRVKPWTARTWMEKLRGEGLVHVAGERKAARWRLLAPPPDGGDAQ